MALGWSRNGDAGKCWREKPTSDTDCYSKEKRNSGEPYDLYNVQNIGNNFSLNIIKIIKYIINICINMVI